MITSPSRTRSADRGAQAPLAAAIALASLVILVAGLALTATRVRSGLEARTLLWLTLEGALFWGVGVAAFRQAPRSPAGLPFLIQCAGWATYFGLVSLLPAAGPPDPQLFVAYGPGSWLHAPSLVHFALALGWPHREQRWRGPVAAWYLVHGVLFLVSLGALLGGQPAVFSAVDGMLRRQALNLVAFLASVGALVWARRMVPDTGGRRRSLDVAWLAIVVAMGPGWVQSFVAPLREALSPGFPVWTALFAALPIGLGIAMLRNRIFDDRRLERDARELQVRLLLERDLAHASADLLQHLCATFDARGAMIRVMNGASPRVLASTGNLAAHWSVTPLSDEVQYDRDPPGVSYPVADEQGLVGEIRLAGPVPGAFGGRELSSLRRLALPLAAVLRSRLADEALRAAAAELAQLAASFAGAGERLEAAARATSAEAQATIDGVRQQVSDLARVQEAAAGAAAVADEVWVEAGRGVEVSRAVDEQGESLARNAQTLAAEIEGAMTTLDIVRGEVDALVARGEEIERISSAINGIAFQTNLLALNAAIEAARAGAEGQGFAVLAEEVRQLAEDSGKSARDIGRLVGKIREEIERGGSALARVLEDMGAAAERGRSGGAIFGATRERLATLVETGATLKDRADRLRAAAATIEAAVQRSTAVARTHLTRAETSRTATEQEATAAELRRNADRLAQAGRRVAEMLDGGR
jgi:methyl-accepting chemotaxis protein